MLIGALLLLTWGALLLRHPTKALPVSAAALCGLLLLALWTVWLVNREQRQLAHLELRLDYVPGTGAAPTCPADRPLLLTLKNASDAPLTELRWKISAYAPGDNLDLGPVDTMRTAAPAPGWVRDQARGARFGYSK